MYYDPYGLAPSWVAPTGAVLTSLGGGTVIAGISTGNPVVSAIGIGLTVIGGGLTIWDVATTPAEQIEKAKERINELKDLREQDLKDLEQLERELEMMDNNRSMHNSPIPVSYDPMEAFCEQNPSAPNCQPNPC